MATFQVTDSEEGIELPSHRIFAVAYEPYWQKVRVRLKFTPFETCRSSIVRLEAYTHFDEDTIAYRLWRVANLMAAIPIGQATKGGWQKIEIPSQRVIIAYRKEVRKRLHEVGMPTTWDWERVWDACWEMRKSKKDSEFLNWLHAKLRWQRATRSTSKPELKYFLHIVKETA